MKENVITQGETSTARHNGFTVEINMNTLVLDGLALVLIGCMASMFIFRK